MRVSEDEYKAMLARRENIADVEPLEKPKRNKYGAKRVVLDGITFDSQKEANRYLDLEIMRMAGKVKFFLRQVPFELPGGVKYRVDFVVFHTDGRVTFEDVKGFETREFINKKKQVEALYPVKIEVLK